MILFMYLWCELTSLGEESEGTPDPTGRAHDAPPDLCSQLGDLRKNMKYVKVKWPGWTCVLMLISHVCLGVVLDTKSHVFLFY